MSFVILAPYSRTETTMAAVRLADFAESRGVRTKLVVCGARQRSVHAGWDHRVLSGRGDGVYRHCRGAKTVVHFGNADVAISQVQLVAEHARQILVPHWHASMIERRKDYKAYDEIICPSMACHAAFHELVFKGRSNRKLTWCRWDSGCPGMQRTCVSDRIRVLVWCDRHTIDTCMGPALSLLIGDTLAKYSHVDFTLVSDKSWTHRDCAELRALANHWGARVAIRRAGQLPDRINECMSHDWLFLPGIRADFGIMAATAHACGTAVVCFDVPPYNEFVFEGHNGVLISCEKENRLGGLRAPVAIPSMGTLAKTWQTAISSHAVLQGLRQKTWATDNLRLAFESLWSPRLSCS